MIQLQEILTKEFLGVIWPSTKALSEKQPPFHGIDYFLDGLLTEFVSKVITLQEINLFFSTSYGHVFFLLQYQGKILDMKRHVPNLADLLKSYKGPYNKILIIGEQDTNLLSFLESHHKKFHFDFFN